MEPSQLLSRQQDGLLNLDEQNLLFINLTGYSFIILRSLR